MPGTQLAGDIAVHLDKQVNCKALKSLFSRSGKMYLFYDCTGTEMYEFINIANM